MTYFLNQLRKDWITTEYNNQSSPSTFYTMGSETSTGAVTNIGFIRFIS